MELYAYMTRSDMTDPACYSYVAERFDLQSLAQWFCYESYFNNLDPTGNIRYCKGNLPDSKWRVMLFDLDIAMGSNQPSYNAIYQMDAQIGNIFNSLDNNEEFRLLVMDTAAQLYRNGLNYETVLAAMDKMTGATAEEAARDIKRWHDGGTYDANLARQRNCFNAERDSAWVRMLQSYSRLDSAAMQQYFPDFYS